MDLKKIDPDTPGFKSTHAGATMGSRNVENEFEKVSGLNPEKGFRNEMSPFVETCQKQFAIILI